MLHEQRCAGALQFTRGSVVATCANVLTLRCAPRAVVQCLAYTPLFRDVLISLQWRDLRALALTTHRRASKAGHKAFGIGDGSVVEAFADVVSCIFKPDVRYVSPRRLKYVVSRLRPMFSGWQQHDAQEFLAALLDCVHEDVNTADGIVVKVAPPPDPVDVVSAASPRAPACGSPFPVTS